MAFNDWVETIVWGKSTTRFNTEMELQKQTDAANLKYKQQENLETYKSVGVYAAVAGLLIMTLGIAIKKGRGF